MPHQDQSPSPAARQGPNHCDSSSNTPPPTPANLCNVPNHDTFSPKSTSRLIRTPFCIQGLSLKQPKGVFCGVWQEVWCRCHHFLLTAAPGASNPAATMKASPIIVNWHAENAPIYSADFQPHGKGRLATGGGDNNVRVW